MRAPQASDTEVLGFLARRVFVERWALAGGTLLLLTLTGARLLLTWLVKLWSDALLAGDVADALERLLLPALAVMALVLVSIAGSRYLLARVDQRILEGLRNDAARAVLRTSPAATWKRRSGDLLSRVLSDCSLAAGLAPEAGKRLVGEGTVIVGSFAMLLVIDWRLALAVCLYVPAAGVLLHLVGRRIRHWSAAARRSLGELSGTFGEQLQGLGTIKGFQTESFEARRFTRRNRELLELLLRGEAWAAAMVGGVWLIAGAGLLWGIVYGSRQVASGRLTSGELLAFCLYAGQAVEPLRRLSDLQARLQQGLAAAERVHELVRLPPEEAMPGTAEPPLPSFERTPTCLELAAVRFAYPDGPAVFDELSGVIEAGEIVGVVAASGGGKSTLAGLLLRFWEPQRGSLLLGGRDLAGLALEEIRRAVCVVPQEPFLFSGSVRDNLLYGEPEASEEDLQAALAMTALDGLFGGGRRGLDTLLPEAGRSLSGGQRQRIALARAVLRAPSLLVLDEATSAMDGDTEERVFRRLEPWLARRTTVVMAHRFATIARLPRVLVLAGGRFVGDGAPEALLRSCASFAELFGGQVAAAARDAVPGPMP